MTDTTTEVKETLYINNINEKVSLNKLKPVLSKLFGRYGDVTQITIHKNLKMKGQAFITYRDPISSQKAIMKLQGRPVFRKPIRIAYAKSLSDEYYKLKGEEEAIEKRKEAKQEREASRKEEVVAQPSTTVNKSQIKQWKSLPPNSVLLLQNLHGQYLEIAFLEEQFQKHAGFERLRLIAFRNLAFLDFESEANATKCLNDLDLAVFGEGALLTYAKK